MTADVACNDKCCEETCTCEPTDVHTLDGLSLDARLAIYREYYDESRPNIERLQAVIDSINAPLKLMEADIKEAIIAAGKSTTAHGVKATYRKGYVRSKWDSKGLLGYAAAHPEILPMYSETIVKPTVSVKVIE